MCDVGRQEENNFSCHILSSLQLDFRNFSFCYAAAGMKTHFDMTSFASPSCIAMTWISTNLIGAYSIYARARETFIVFQLTSVSGKSWMNLNGKKIQEIEFFDLGLSSLWKSNNWSWILKLLLLRHCEILTRLTKTPKTVFLFHAYSVHAWRCLTLVQIVLTKWTSKSLRTFTTKLESLICWSEIAEKVISNNPQYKPA